MVCHTRAANYVLGLSALQMNRAHDYGTTTENQLEVLERLGIFHDKLPRRPAEMPAPHRSVRWFGGRGSASPQLLARQLLALSRFGWRRQRQA